MTIANWLTVLRIILIPVFVSLLIYRELSWALALFLMAVVTDMLDGFVARRTQVTALGSFLDPLADKLLLVSAFVILPIVSPVPVWVAVVVVSRDVIIALGYLVLSLNWGATQIQVRPLGKLTTFIQSLCVAGTIVGMLLSAEAQGIRILAYGAALITGASAVDYILQGIYRANQMSEQNKEGPG